MSANVKFTITDSRSNGFYKYVKTDSSDKSEGWGLYTTWTDEVTRKAWVEGVKRYNKSNNIKTRADDIKKEIQDIRDLFKTEDNKFPDKKSLIMPGLGDALKLLSANDDNCTDEVIEKLMEPLGGNLPTPINMLKYAWSSTQFNIRLDISKALHGTKELGVNSLIEPVLSLGDNIADDYLSYAAIIDKETHTHARKAFAAYNKAYELSESDPDASKEKLGEFETEMNNTERKFGTDVRDAVYECLCIDELVSLFSLFKNFQNTDTKVWQTLIGSLSFLTNLDLKPYASGKLSALNQLMKDLLALLAALAGAFIAQKCAEGKEADVDEKTIADALGCSPDKIDDAVEAKAKKQQEEIASQYELYPMAMSKVSGYSITNPADDVPAPLPRNLLTSPQTVEEAQSILDKEIDCMISVCDYDPGTDMDSYIDRLSMRSADEVAIDFSNKLIYDITVQAGQKVEPNQIIAHISGVPVRSPFAFTVKETSKGYITGTYDEMPLTTTDDEGEKIADDIMANLNKQMEAYDENSYNELTKDFENLMAAEDFIREYISYFRFPEMAQYTREHVKGDAVEISSREFVEEYESYADGYKDDYIEKIKSLSSKKHLQPLLKAGKVACIKKERDDAKKKFISNIMTLYRNNPGNIKFCSKGRICDFLLYDMYTNYIASDRFNYDEDNPYVVRLSDALDTIIGRRIRLELNMENAEGLIRNFNELCDKTIKRYWPFGDADYYEKLSELFTGEFYLDTSDITPLEKVDGAITMYKRVVKYIKALCRFAPDDDEELQVTADTDINKLMEEQGKRSADSTYSKNKIKLEKAIKNIAYRFCSLRKVERSISETKTGDYITNQQLRDFYELRKVAGQEVDGYKEGMIYGQYVPSDTSTAGTPGAAATPNILYGKESVLGAYIKMLKTVTADDANILRGIVNEVTGWHETYAESIDNCSSFAKFSEIEWGSSSIIYHEGVPMDYYRFGEESKPDSTSLDDLIRMEDELSSMNIPDEQTMDFYPATAARTNKIPYWIKYCAMASLTNLMLPVYWSTGLIISGSPLKLPIIYIPIVVLSGRVTVVMGIGLCGICIYPMLLFVNIGNLTGSLLIPINVLVDATLKKLKGLGNTQMKSIETLLKPMVKALDNEIVSLEKEMEDIDYQLQEIKNIKDEPKARRSLDKKKKTEA